MSSSSYRSFITRESFEDIQILDMKNLMRIPADIEPYYLGAALKMEKPMKSKQMVLEWLRTKKIGILLNYSSEWKRGVSPFVKENLNDFRPLIGSGRQLGDLTLWDNRRNVCTLLIEVISDKDPQPHSFTY